MEEIPLEGFSIPLDEFSIDFPSINASLICFAAPGKSNSNGVIGSITGHTHFLTYSMPLLELQMGFILILSHLTRFVLKPFGISNFVACALAGVFLGPNGIGKYDFTGEIIFPQSSQDTISTIALLGYNIYVFLAAVQMDIRMVLRTGRKALSVGTLSVIIPYTCFSLYQRFQHHEELITKLWAEDTQVITIVVVTSLPAVAYVVDQLKLTNTELGRLALASGLVGDVFGISIYTIRFLRNLQSLDEAMRNLVPVLVFILGLIVIFRPMMDWVIRRTPEREPLSSTFICIIMAFAIVSEAYFFIIGQTQFLAPFLFGLAVPSGAPLGATLVEKFGSFTDGVLMYVLIPTALMRADLHLVMENFANLRKQMNLIFLCFFIKTIACIAPSMILKMRFSEAVALAFIMNYTNVVQLSMATVFRDVQLLEEDVYAVVALYILLNATIFPIMISYLYPSRKYEGHEALNFLGLKPSTELKILACIHEQDDVESYIKLLNAIHPTKESPVNIYALHLIELIGRYVPIMVSHSKDKPISTSTSQNIVYALNQYEQNNWDSISIQISTAMSSFPLMHEDILNVALEKKTPLIILPLHRRWSIHGHVESEDKRRRSVNCNVIEKAPCSVAIFFNRGRFGQRRIANSSTSKLSVCMIFFGGNDDREALAIAKRMLMESELTTLTVFHCLPVDGEDFEDLSEDHIYDVVTLEDIKNMALTNKRLDYRAQVMNDGPDTIMALRSMANLYDLFIIGRRFGVQTPQTSGLSEWSELPELGIIGDLLASKDFTTRASVLVVQQRNKSKRHKR